ncbi:ATP-NAD kinase-like domain-containing protein [Scenedesmus sp. NREL 46B-D3]|nr:ATP-NAD kinase-like domain-containing protein [Scenedesmus sp. NREL 46B-D3]
MRKLARSTEAAFLRALEWLRRHHITIYVEPKVYQDLLDQGRVLPQQQQQQQQQQSSGTGSSSSSSGCLCGMLVNTAAAKDGAAAATPTASAAAGAGGNGTLVSFSSWPAPPGGQSRFSSSSSSVSGVSAFSNAAPAGPGAAPLQGAGLVKTWRPEERACQQQQQQGEGDGGGSSVDVAQQLDLVVVLGGDGTVLWTCHIFGNRSVPPLVPFNLGSLGFLTPFDPTGLEKVLHKTLRGLKLAGASFFVRGRAEAPGWQAQLRAGALAWSWLRRCRGFPITLRHRLHCTIVRGANSRAACSATDSGSNGGGSGSGMPCVSNSCVGRSVDGEEHVSLNEVVIERGISPFLTNLECFCDGAFVTHVQGDGLIIGTPTGSTAYSLASGGSMVHPQVPCILFTPISPHSLSFRPLMFPDYCQLCIQVPVNSRGHVWASFDGKDRTELVPGDAVVVRLSRWPVPSVAAEADPSGDWFSAVRECLHWNIRKVQGGAGS